MAYDEGLAQRIREVMAEITPVQEKRMFGGLAFMVRGHMCCGVVRDELMLRVGAAGYAEALAQPYAREMDFTGRPLTGFVYVGERGFERDEDLRRWIDRAYRFVETLPDKC